jgi:hypothetical protein
MPQNVIVFQPDMPLGELIERFGTEVQCEAAHAALLERKGLCYPMRRQQIGEPLSTLADVRA